jgi:hypothetical protein
VHSSDAVMHRYPTSANDHNKRREPTPEGPLLQSDVFKERNFFVLII